MWQQPLWVAALFAVVMLTACNRGPQTSSSSVTPDQRIENPAQVGANSSGKVAQAGKRVADADDAMVTIMTPL